MTHQPKIQALLLADQVYSDARTGKRIIAGTFTQLNAAGFPAMFERVTYAYVALTDCRAPFLLTLRYVDDLDLRVILEAEPVPIECIDPLAVVELVIAVPPFPMPHPGSYSFELHSGDVLLGSLRVMVKQHE